MWRRFKVRRLISKLESSDSDQRKAAILALGELRAVEGLLSIRSAALTDTDYTVRQAAGRVAATLDRTGLVQTLLSLLSVDEPNLRANALQLIEFAPDPRMAPGLTAILLDESAGYMPWLAAEALGHLGVKETVPVLIGQLDRHTRDYPFLQHLAKSIARIGDRRGIDPLVNVLVKLVPQFSTAKNPSRLGKDEADHDRRDEREIRRTVAEALAGLGEEKWSKWILGDDNDGIRLAMSGDRSACEIVLPRARDQSIDGDRRAYQSVLATLGRQRASEVLVIAAAKTLGSGYAVARSLIDLGVGSVVPSLQKILSDHSWGYNEWREQIANVVLKLSEHPLVHDHTDIDSAKRLLYDSRGGEGAIELISGLRDVAVLSDILHDRRMEYSSRVHAATVLGKLADPPALSELCSSLHVEDENIRAEVARVLGATGNAAAVAPLVKGLDIEFTSSFTEVRFAGAVAHALAAIGTNQAASAMMSNLRRFGPNGIGAMRSLLREHGDKIDHSILRAIREIADFSFEEVHIDHDGSPSPVGRTVDVDCGDLRHLAAELLARQGNKG